MKRWVRLALLVLVVAFSVSACGRPAVSVAGGPPLSPVVGVLVAVDSAGLSDVRGFALRLVDDRVVDFKIGTLENGAEFPPGHLAEHLASSDPVRVFFRPEAAGLVVYRIEDAG